MKCEQEAEQKNEIQRKMASENTPGRTIAELDMMKQKKQSEIKKKVEVNRRLQEKA